MWFRRSVPGLTTRNLIASISIPAFFLIATATNAQQLPEAVLIEVEQTFDFRKPSSIELTRLENYELPVRDYVEDILFAADIDMETSGVDRPIVRVTVQGRATGRLYFEPERAFLYTGADIAGVVEIEDSTGATVVSEFQSTIERPFQISINLGYETPENAPFLDALEQPDGFIEHLCEVMAMAWGDESILPALNEPRDSIRVGAAAALGSVGSESAIPALIDALHDSYDRVRWESAWSLGRIGDWRAVPELIDALLDESQDVRWFASWSLRNITGERTGPDHESWSEWWDNHQQQSQGS